MTEQGKEVKEQVLVTWTGAFGASKIRKEVIKSFPVKFLEKANGCHMNWRARPQK
jgi:hypothetical protein